jgi:hypothetical protein
MLKLRPMMAAGMLAGSAAAAIVNAGPPLLDRPSPPACCADGVCYPNPTTWGYYQAQWRRWPTAPLEPTPEAVPPGGRLPEVPPLELPTKEEEDRAAPPRTKAADRAREEEEEATTPPPTGLEPSGQMPIGPSPGGVQPPTRPGENGPEVPTMRMPWDIEPPATPDTETAPAPLGPTGDLDPPPAPPFATPSLVNRPGTRAAKPPTAQPEPRRAAPASHRPISDPPPPFPIAHLGR